VRLDGQQLVWSKGAPVWRGHRRVRERAIHGQHLTVALAPMSAVWVELRGHAR
jgi:hypothetical protein